MIRKSALFYGSLLVSCCLSGRVAAQDTGPKIIPKSVEGVDDAQGKGWHAGLRFAGNTALGQSKNVPGTSDGVSVQLGYMIGAGLDFLSAKKTNEWTNLLSMELAYTRTPVVDAFIKSIDKIDFKSSYLYHPTKLPWIGPFVAFRLSAPMLPGYEVNADPLNVIRLEPDEELAFNDAGEPIDENGNVIDADHPSVTRVKGGKKIDLTDAFAPLTLRESVGAFATPLEKPWLKTDMRLGFGAWETFVRGGFVAEDSDKTADLYELRRLRDSVQVGPELGILLSGAFKDNLTYFASALFMYPVYENTNTKLEGVDLLNMEFEAGLSVKITKYVSIDYSFKAYKQPLIVNNWQIQNNVIFTVAFEVPPPVTPPPACPAVPECPACPAVQAATADTGAADAPAEVTAETDASVSDTLPETAAAPSSDDPDTGAGASVPAKVAPPGE